MSRSVCNVQAFGSLFISDAVNQRINEICWVHSYLMAFSLMPDVCLYVAPALLFIFGASCTIIMKASSCSLLEISRRRWMN